MRAGSQSRAPRRIQEGDGLLKRLAVQERAPRAGMIEPTENEETPQEGGKGSQVLRSSIQGGQEKVPREASEK